MRMKIRTIKYIVKEGIINTYKNKLMSLASVGIVTAALVLFGIFWLMVTNLNHNAETLKEQPEMRVFCEYELEDSAVTKVAQRLRSIENIESVSLVTPREAFNKFKETLGENADVLEGFDENLMSASYIVKIHDTSKSEETIGEIKKVEGVRKVSYSKDVVEVISKLTYWARLITSFLIIILVAVSMFIISNTIKLTVFARRREINIMKYIGATDWFIRWPFIVEGIIIGVIGALIAFVLTRYGYNTVEVRFNNDLQGVTRDFISLVKISDLSSTMIMLYSLIGGVVGALGSLISIRKYLRV
jgi:cell division transport system permease protein